MLIDDSTFKELCDAFLNNESITISGCNPFGQEFETTGKIAPVKCYEVIDDYPNQTDTAIGISSDVIILEFGKKSENEFRSQYCTKFTTDLYEDEFFNFVIKEIKLKRTGKVVFKNEDYQSYYEYCRVYHKNYNKTLLKENITPAVMDRKCQELSNFVGKPVNIFGYTGILLLVDSSAKGEILLYVINDREVKDIIIPRTYQAEGKNILKISERKTNHTFDDYILNRFKK